MSRLVRDGTAEPVSRDQILRHARGQWNIRFPCSADHEQDWQPYPVDPYSAICDDKTYIHMHAPRQPHAVCLFLNEFSHNNKLIFPWSRGRKTPSGREKRTTHSPYKEKTVKVPKYSGKSSMSKETKKGRHTKKGKTKTKKDVDGGNCVWLSGRMHIEERRTIERRAAASSVKQKKKKKKKQLANNNCLHYFLICFFFVVSEIRCRFFRV